MIHAQSDLAGARPLGSSGLYLGGLAAAAERVDAGDADADDFKFFFNFAKWGPRELDDAVADGRWTAYDGVPEDISLRQDRNADAGALWLELDRAAKANLRAAAADE